MSEPRERVVYAALWTAESAWVYAAVGAACAVFGLESSPLPWATMAALLAAGMTSAWVLGGVRGDPARLAIIQGLLGLIAVYLAGATQRFDAVPGLNMLWVAHAFGDGLGRYGLPRLIISVAIALWLWMRATRLVIDRPLTERIQRTFRIGMVAVAAALIIELVSGSDIGARQALLPFFAASLTGMAASRLADPATEARARAWTRVVATSVGTILVAGLALGLASGAYGRAALHLLHRGWEALVDALLWALRYPLQAVFWLLSTIWRWLTALFGATGERHELTDFGGAPAEFPERAEKAFGADWLETIIRILRYPLAIILLIVVFFLLVLAFQRLRRRPAAKEPSDRESVRGDADVRSDFLRLFGRLLPDWMRRRPGPPLWRYPLGEPGVTEVFLLYFDYLSEAIRRGMPLDTRQTPTERQETLQAALPGSPVALLTARFNAACYGREPSDAGLIEGLSRGLTPSPAGSPRTA